MIALSESSLASEVLCTLSVVTAEGDSAFERLASIVGLVDFATVYLGLANGFDPTPIGPIDDLKARLAND